MRSPGMPASQSPLTLAGLAILAAAALVFPWRASDYLLHVTIISIYYAMLASSWALLAGYAGQFSFAHMALAALGGYSSALLVQYTGLPVPVGMLAAVLLPAITGGLIGWLCLRMSGPYLALFTLAFAVIFQLILIAEYEFTRGSLGLEVAPLFSGRAEHLYYYTSLGLLGASLAAMHALVRSRVGLFLQAIREDEDAAEACGVATARFKIVVFTLSSAVAGLAGAFYGHYVGILTPNIVTIPEMGLIVAMAVIGGIESLAAAVIGAIVVYIASEELREFGQLRFVLLGLAIMLTQRFAQNGLVAPLIGRLAPRRRSTAAAVDSKAVSGA
jgi:branched-chain amino acid transport system permease protein